MKKVLLTMFLFCSLFALGQSKKEIDDGIFVTFPTIPEYEANTKTTTYIAKTDNCLYMTIVQLNVIPNYPQYVQAKKKFTAAEIKKIEDSFLDNVVQGKLGYTDSKGSISEIKMGQFSGRKVEYSALNIATGERGKRFAVLLMVRNQLINFECFYLLDNEVSKIEKDKFLNSIQIQ